MKKGPILLANSSEQNLCEKICSYRGAKLDENRTSTPTNSTIMQSIGAVCRLVVISPAVSSRDQSAVVAPRVSVAWIGHRARVRPSERPMAQVRIRPVYPLEDLAADFGVSLNLVRREIREGRLAAFRIERLVRVAGEDAVEWRDRYRDASLDDGDSSQRAA